MTPDPQHCSRFGHDGEDVDSPTAAAHRLSAKFRELKEYAQYLASARADGFKAKIRGTLMKAALGAIAALVGVTIIIVASVLLLLGLADGLSRLAGTGPWLGELVVGFIVLAAIGLGAYWMVRRMTGSSRERTIRRYEQRQERQREQFGRSVADQAAAKVGD